MIYPIILAGGSGTRLWPVSRSLYPKQFINLYGEKSLLQNTVERLSGLDAATPIVVCNEEHRFIVAEQLKQIDCRATIVLEPEGRDTAPAITIAALIAQAKAHNSDPTLLVLSADHHIENKTEFTRSIELAISQSEAGKLVTFGISPTSAHTGYGYIHRGHCMVDNAVFDVNEFVEKPNHELAEKYVESGEYYWNCGIFMFSASTILAEVKKFQPNILTNCTESLKQISFENDFVRLDQEYFLNCENKSIDYAVIEHTSKAIVVLLNCPWHDVGCWSSLWNLMEKDQQGNVSSGNVLMHQTTNSLVRSDYRLVATIGLENIIVIETHDAVLVANKDNEEELKNLVNQLKAEKRTEYHHHRQVYRPWGKYDSIDEGNRYQVKHITVKPGEKLSVQKHLHRAEHWTVVRGTASIQNGDEFTLLTEDQSTYIPIGVIHSLENKGKIPLELIEVQSGAYLGEDDIIRFEDIYGREQETVLCKP
ncbi:MAG: mannose-1-phosphate guanylyltransferase/mannose-6-phosphate isomerase [Colwellia sp.]|nr:mannose-1-phosphate guanylyltransferase/mannose-6-phosphate isomerase [Colwellia sp.]